MPEPNWSGRNPSPHTGNGGNGGGAGPVEYIQTAYTYTDVAVEDETGIAYIPGFATLNDGDIFLTGGCEITEAWDDSQGTGDFALSLTFSRPITSEFALSGQTNNPGVSTPAQGLLNLSTPGNPAGNPDSQYTCAVAAGGGPVTIDIFVANFWEGDSTTGALIARAVIVRANP